MQPINQLLDNDAFIKKIQYVIITLFILLIAFDVYLAVDQTVDDDTISRILKNYTDNGYMLTFFWGALVANFFFPTKKPLLVSGTVGSIILMVVAIFIYWFSLGTMVKNILEPVGNDLRITHAIYMVIGFLMAFLLWRQPK